MKPSLKNKLSADKIEAANRELNESKPTAASAQPVVVAEPQKVVEVAPKPQNTEGVNDFGTGMSDVGTNPKSQFRNPKSNRVGESDFRSVISDVDNSPKSEIRNQKSVKSSRRSKIAIQAEEENLRLVRVTIDIPEALHEKMKIKMILTKQTMKDYLLDFIRKDVGNTNFGFK
jgi:hypothetical protein